MTGRSCSARLALLRTCMTWCCCNQLSIPEHLVIARVSVSSWKPLLQVRLFPPATVLSQIAERPPACGTGVMLSASPDSVTYGVRLAYLEQKHRRVHGTGHRDRRHTAVCAGVLHTDELPKEKLETALHARCTPSIGLSRTRHKAACRQHMSRRFPIDACRQMSQRVMGMSCNRSRNPAATLAQSCQFNATRIVSRACQPPAGRFSVSALDNSSWMTLIRCETCASRLCLLASASAIDCKSQ